MASHYKKPVHALMKEMIPTLNIEKGSIFTRSQVKAWFSEHYPKIKEGTINAHLIRLSTNSASRTHYNTKEGADDVFYQIDSSHFRLYSPETDPRPIYEKDTVNESESDDEILTEQSTQEFAYEKDLQNFLVKNLDAIEPGLTLFQDDGVSGVEFPVGGRFIDILAVDKEGSLVVIELKVSKGYDKVVGQLLRYVAWIKINQAEDTQKVRGMIIARTISEDLKLACSGINDLQLFEYQISVSLEETKAY